jgi:protein gp37
MADNSSIEWTEATWNPLLGCSRVSPGCDSCYAINTATIRAGNPHPRVAAAFEGLTERRDGRLDWTGRINLLPERLTQPMSWRKPKRIFVNSQSDLFHADVPDEYIAKVFAVMALVPQHTFQLLTKRHARMRSLLNSHAWWTRFSIEVAEMRKAGQSIAYDADGPHLPNLWLGVSVEDQKWADIRIPALLDTPAAVRWISAEPLLGPVDLSEYLDCQEYKELEYVPGTGNVAWYGPKLGWIVCGGESGPGARPMHPDWARGLRDQCAEASVPFFFKQWGNWVAPNEMPPDTFMDWDVENGTSAYDRDQPWRVGKKRAGRLLDGRTWDEYPEPSREVSGV